MSDGSIEYYKGTSPLLQTLQELEKRAEGYFRSARAPNTVKAYR